jgi:hypothetical protein
MPTISKRGERRKASLCKPAILLAWAALMALAGCYDGRPFDTGWDRFTSDRRDRITVSRPFETVAIQLQERLQRAGMDRLKAAASREPSLFTVEGRRVLITHLWLAGPENVAPFASFFSCPGARAVVAAAGTLFVVELDRGTELEFHLGFATTDDPTALDVCTLRPGLLASLAAWVGIT